MSVRDVASFRIREEAFEKAYRDVLSVSDVPQIKVSIDTIAVRRVASHRRLETLGGMLLAVGLRQSMAGTWPMLNVSRNEKRVGDDDFITAVRAVRDGFVDLLHEEAY